MASGEFYPDHTPRPVHDSNKGVWVCKGSEQAAVALATAVSSPERIAEHTLSWSVAVATPESRDDVGTLGHIFPALVDFHEGVFPQ